MSKQLFWVLVWALIILMAVAAVSLAAQASHPRAHLTFEGTVKRGTSFTPTSTSFDIGPVHWNVDSGSDLERLLFSKEGTKVIVTLESK